MYFRVFCLDFTAFAGAESCRPRERLTDQLLIAKLILKEESVKLWRRVCRYIARTLLSRKESRDLFTRSTIQQLPVSMGLLRETRRNSQKEVPDPQPDLLKGGTCPSCGGKTRVRVLNYWCEPWTDVVSPADTIEHCIVCDWSGPIMEDQRPM